MTQPTPEIPLSEEVHQLVLTDECGLGRLAVDMQAFFEFSFWMAEELEDLVRQGPKVCRRRMRSELIR